MRVPRAFVSATPPPTLPHLGGRKHCSPIGAASFLLGLVLHASTGLSEAASDASPPPPPRVREIEIQGATVYDRERVLKVLRLKPGDALWREAAEVARSLEIHYRLEGYLAARVTGAFDPGSGTLILEVDEGRLTGVEVEGVQGRAAERAKQELGLETGKLLREPDVLAGLARLSEASEGTVVSQADPEGGVPYSVRWTEEGAVLVVSLRPPALRGSLRLGGPGVSSVYNRVEGLAPGLGVELLIPSPASFKHTALYAGASYGFSSKDPRYAMGVSRPLGGAARLTLGYEYHDLTDTDDAFRSFNLSYDQGKTIFFSSYQDYFRRKGHEAYAFARLGRRSQLGLSFRSDTYESLPVTTDGSLLFDKTPRPNIVVREGLMRSAVATLRWTSGGGLFETRQAERESNLVRSLYGSHPTRGEVLRVEGTLELASPNTLGGDYDFRRAIATARAHPSLLGRPLHMRLLLGFSGGTPPPQKLFALGGIGSLRGYERRELVGENMALATLEWQALKDRFPLPGFVFFYDGGRVWTRARDDPGWKNVMGTGLEFALSGRGLLRVDTAFVLESRPGRGRTSTTFKLKAPF